MITLKNPYDSWLTLNSKWLPSKSAEITLIGQWAQYWQYTPHIPARNVRKLSYIVTGTYPNMSKTCLHVGIGPSDNIRQVSYVPGGCMWGPLCKWSN